MCLLLTCRHLLPPVLSHLDPVAAAGEQTVSRGDKTNLKKSPKIRHCGDEDTLVLRTTQWEHTPSRRRNGFFFRVSSPDGLLERGLIRKAWAIYNGTLSVPKG